MTHHQAEIVRLQRYRDAGCETDYAWQEPDIEGHGKWLAEALLVGAMISALGWFGIGAIMVACLQ